MNDGRPDRSGNFVFGTLNEHPDRASVGSFYQFSIRYGLRRLALGSVAVADSVCFSPDGRTMYYCDSLERRIMQCRYDANSADVSEIRTFVAFGALHGLPDGSAIDEDGCLWNAAWGGAVVRRLTPAGTIDREIHLPVINPTCAFGGQDLRDVYITSSRQNMSTDDLASMPHAGGVYRATPGDVRGVADPTFHDS